MNKYSNENYSVCLTNMGRPFYDILVFFIMYELEIKLEEKCTEKRRITIYNPSALSHTLIYVDFALEITYFAIR